MPRTLTSRTDAVDQIRDWTESYDGLTDDQVQAAASALWHEREAHNAAVAADEPSPFALDEALRGAGY